MKGLPLLLTIFLTSNLAAGQDIQKIYHEAIEAYEKRDSITFYAKMFDAYRMFPSNQTILYKLGIAAALNQKNAEAFEYLQKAIMINADFRLEGEKDLNSLKQSTQWPALIALQQTWQEPVINSIVAMTLKDRQLHPEVIAFDSTEKSFYVGSIHKRKIVKIDKDSAARDFCVSAYQGMTSVLGIKLDKKRKLLWVCSSPLKQMVNFDSISRSAIFKLDLVSGKLIKKYEIPKPLPDAIFQDLILDRNGDVYLSDARNNQILKIDSKQDKLETMFKSPLFLAMQGMTFSKDEKYLFISDYEKGLIRLDVATKVLTEIGPNEKASARGIDGIYYFNNSILAIQNGTVPARVVQFFLNNQQDTIKYFKVIDKNRPDFGEPTTGFLSGKAFYYIANSQWNGYNANHEIKSPEQLKDTIILKYHLQ